VAPGIPDRLVRVSGIRPRSFLVEGVFGAAHPIQRFQHVLDVTEVDLREAVNVFKRALGFCKVLIELRTIDPFYGYAIFTKGVVDKRHQLAQSDLGDRLQPARPGLIAVFGRPCFIEPDKKFPKAIAINAAFPCEESRGAKQRFTDESVDRAVDDQVQQRVDAVIEHAGDNFGQALSDGIAENGVDLIEGPTQQRPACFPVTRSAQV
jgi:hypothetical protein